MAASANKVRDLIDEAIKASSEVKEGNYVTVKVEKSGLFGKAHITLTGRTTSEVVKAKVNEIAVANAAGVDVRNEMRVSTTA